MTLFWFIAALMVLGCLTWLLPAMLNTKADPNDAAPTHTDHAVASFNERVAALEQDHEDGLLSAEQLHEAKEEMSRELLQDVRPEPAVKRAGNAAGAWIVAAAIPVFTYFAYVELGTPAGMSISGPGIAPVRIANASGAAASGGETASGGEAAKAMPSIEEMVKGLAARLEKSPEDGEGWLMLGRSYVVLNRMTDAEQAYARAYALQPANVEVLTSYAETLARNNNNALQGRPLELVAAALKLSPTHPKSLWLSGIAAMQRNDGTAAADYWTRLKETGALNAEETTSINEMIAEATGTKASSAKAVASNAAAPSTRPAPVATPPSESAPSKSAAPQPQGVFVKVRVTLAPEVAAKVGANDSLFVFARAESGPPMPLAVVRGKASDLPFDVILDESMAMMPQMTLATFPRIVVGARLSKTGNARPSPGDVQGLSAALNPKEQDSVEVIISTVVGG